MKETKERKENKEKDNVVKIPLRNIKMMTDEEWNRLAYRNMLERRCGA